MAVAIHGMRYAAMQVIAVTALGSLAVAFIRRGWLNLRNTALVVVAGVMKLA